MSLIKADHIAEHTAAAGITLDDELHATAVIDAQAGISLGNVLSVYEEGTWTPTVVGNTTAGTNGYDIQDGLWTRIGRMVIAQCTVALNTKDPAMAGDIYVAGLPFASGADATAYAAGCLALCNFVGLDTGYTQIGFTMPPNSSRAEMTQLGDNVLALACTAPNIKDNTSFILTLTYFV